jgi:hypothetical protein
MAGQGRALTPPKLSLCVCVLLGIGAAPVVRPFTARPRSAHWTGDRCTDCFLVVVGAVRDLLLSAKHLFLAAKARRQRAQTRGRFCYGAAAVCGGGRENRQR